MADVAKGSVLLTPKFDNLEATISKQLESAFGKFSGSSYGSSVGQGFTGGFSAKIGAIVGIAQEVASRAFDAIASSLDSAIARVDTLNNFPRVMQNLGYSAEDAQTSIDRLSAAIDGMPTSLDSIVSMTQQLAPMCGGLDEATDLSIALNNAFLAGGASTYDQARAMQQYTQMLAKGKPELEDWRTLQEVMPGQLNQIAQALLGTTANSNDLYEAMKDGTVSMDDFNAAIVSLNEEGVNGFASFEQQAKDATQGIGTAIENVQNRISKAVGKVIEAIGPENISGAINSFSSSFGPIADTIAGYIEAAKPYIGDFIDFVVSNGPAISAAVAGIAGAFTALQVVKTLSGPLSTFGSAIGIVMTSIKNIGVMQTAADSFKLLGSAISGAFGGPVGIAIAAIAGIVAALVVLWNTNEGFRNAVTTAWNAIVQFISPAIQQIQSLVEQAWPAIQQAVSSAMTAIQAAVQIAWPVIQQIFATVGTAILAIVQTAWPVIQAVITGVMGVIQTFITSAWPVIQNAFTLAGTVIMAIVNAVWPVIQSVITTIMGAIQAFITTAWPIIQAAFTVACGVIQGVINTVFPVIQGVISTVMGAINAVISAVLAIIQGDWEGAWNTISSFLSGIWDTMKTTVSDAIDGVIQFFIDLPGNILSALGDLGSLLISAGEDLVQGFIDGIGNLAQSVTDTLGGIINGAIDFGKSLLGIASPSKVFREIGEYTMQGLAIGIKDDAELAADALDSAVGGLSAHAAVDLSASAVPPASSGKGATSLYIENFNVNANDLRDVRTVEEFSARVFGLELSVL